MAVWTGWRNPTVDPVDGDWDFQVFDGVMSLCKLVSGQWVKVVSFAAEGSNIGATDADKLDGQHGAYYEPAFSKNTAFNKDFAGSGSATTVAKSDHAHSGIAGLTKNVYKVYDAVNKAVGTYIVDLTGNVPSGTTAAFVYWKATAGTYPTIVRILDYAGTQEYGWSESIAWGSGSCIVPLDASYRFKVEIANNATNPFTLIVTYIG